MKKLFTYCVFCVVSSLILVSCQRDRSVYAGNESDYHPRSAPVAHELNQDVEGELVRISIPAKTFVIRVANGMEQTFRFDDATAVVGLDGNAQVRDLVGKEGSEVTVQSQPDEVIKMATRVDVIQIITAKNVRHRRNQRNQGRTPISGTSETGVRP